jgi:hypothetical protein
MKYVKGTLAFAVVACVLAVPFAAAGMAAAPEFKLQWILGCSEKPGGFGEYETKAICEKFGEETVGGLFKMHPSFTTKSGTTTLFSKEKAKVTCTSSSGKGETTGESGTENAKKITKFTIAYSGCKAEKGKETCEVKSTGAGKGEVKTAELSGELGKVAKGEAASERGLELKPKEGGVLVKLEGTCLPSSPASVEGNVIGEIKPVKAGFKTTGELVLACSGEVQTLKKFEGGKEAGLKAFGSAACYEGKNEIAYEETLEIT